MVACVCYGCGVALSGCLTSVSFNPERKSRAHKAVVKPRELFPWPYPSLKRNDLVAIPCSSDLLASLLLDPGPLTSPYSSSDKKSG